MKRPWTGICGRRLSKAMCALCAMCAMCAMCVKQASRPLSKKGYICFMVDVEKQKHVRPAMPLSDTKKTTVIYLLPGSVRLTQEWGSNGDQTAELHHTGRAQSTSLWWRDVCATAANSLQTVAVHDRLKVCVVCVPWLGGGSGRDSGRPGHQDDSPTDQTRAGAKWFFAPRSLGGNHGNHCCTAVGSNSSRKTKLLMVSPLWSSHDNDYVCTVTGFDSPPPPPSSYPSPRRNSPITELFPKD